MLRGAAAAVAAAVAIQCQKSAFMAFLEHGRGMLVVVAADGSLARSRRKHHHHLDCKILSKLCVFVYSKFHFD